MTSSRVEHVIIGCGDVGRRIARQLIKQKVKPDTILGIIRSSESASLFDEIGIKNQQIDFDSLINFSEKLVNVDCYYLVPPPKEGVLDLRSQTVLSKLTLHSTELNRVVLISTTGVYGDCAGEWVTEKSVANPQTERGKRRLHSERLWTEWCKQLGCEINILRVPGIYANSRIPRNRINKKIPVVIADECGFTNRVHADDLATISIVAMQSKYSGQIYNATDGVPGKITEYLQTAALEIGAASLPEITMQQARQELSQGMLSYLSESRKISNQKMLEQLDIELRYPDFKQGLKFG